MFYLMISKYGIFSNIKVTKIERSALWDTRYKDVLTCYTVEDKVGEYGGQSTLKFRDYVVEGVRHCAVSANHFESNPQ